MIQLNIKNIQNVLMHTKLIAFVSSLRRAIFRLPNLVSPVQEAELVAIRVIYGQSNAVGSIPGSVSRPIYQVNPWPEALWMPNTGIRMGLPRGGALIRLCPDDTQGFTPLVSQSSVSGRHGTTIAEGASFQVCAYWARESKRVPKSVVINLGWGGRSIKALSPGSALYEDAQMAISRVCGLLEAHGFIPYVEYVDFDQGEADSTSRQWSDDVIKLRDDFNADVMRRTKQEVEIPWLLTQPSSFRVGASEMVRCQYALCKSRPREFIQTGPSYHLRYQQDLLHRREGSHALKGEFNGLCVARVLYQKRLNATLQWNSVKYDAETQILRLIPSITVTRDRKIKDPGNWGFNVYDGAGKEIPIMAVRISNKGRYVDLKMSTSVEPGIHRSVDYAINSRHVHERKWRNSIPRGQIRTRHPFGTSYHERLPLYAYMPHSREYF